MKNLLVLSLIFLLAACGGNKTIEEVENIEVIMTKHGADISEDQAVEISEFAGLIQGKDSVELKLSGTIEDVCQTKGCWMTLYLEDSTSLMVRFKDYEFFVPKDAQGKTAIVQGFAHVDTISVADQKHYLEDRNASKEEIEAITEEEITFSFEAEGVIIKEEIVVTDEK